MRSTLGQFNQRQEEIRRGWDDPISAEFKRRYLNDLPAIAMLQADIYAQISDEMSRCLQKVDAILNGAANNQNERGDRAGGTSSPYDDSTAAWWWKYNQNER